MKVYNYFIKKTFRDKNNIILGALFAVMFIAVQGFVLIYGVKYKMSMEFIQVLSITAPIILILFSASFIVYYFYKEIIVYYKNGSWNLELRMGQSYWQIYLRKILISLIWLWVYLLGLFLINIFFIVGINKDVNLLVIKLTQNYLLTFIVQVFLIALTLLIFSFRKPVLAIILSTFIALIFSCMEIATNPYVFLDGTMTEVMADINELNIRNEYAQKALKLKNNNKIFKDLSNNPGDILNKYDIIYNPQSQGLDKDEKALFDNYWNGDVSINLPIFFSGATVKANAPQTVYDWMFDLNEILKTEVYQADKVDNKWAKDEWITYYRIGHMGFDNLTTYKMPKYNLWYTYKIMNKNIDKLVQKGYSKTEIKEIKAVIKFAYDFANKYDYARIQIQKINEWGNSYPPMLVNKESGFSLSPNYSMDIYEQLLTSPGENEIYSTLIRLVINSKMFINKPNVSRTNEIVKRIRLQSYLNPLAGLWAINNFSYQFNEKNCMDYSVLGSNMANFINNYHTVTFNTPIEANNIRSFAYDMNDYENNVVVSANHKIVYPTIICLSWLLASGLIGYWGYYQFRKSIIF
ncbi:hypothetical protein [Spiroplasma chrysopicola]|uniref:Uncharacterized protein n=1 Tax=Spiroplasma chrysopicola DF-1 TaxID=1276227 RepID=R4U2Y3_9MOLU|nr:hypothetical protein [Spiroplasma chrysopicola]AGM24848.1 hypothetical protein SCHRY_v1c02630 [Spiroplasma chrysopicola DF-1]